MKGSSCVMTHAFRLSPGLIVAFANQKKKMIAFSASYFSTHNLGSATVAPSKRYLYQRSYFLHGERPCSEQVLTSSGGNFRSLQLPLGSRNLVQFLTGGVGGRGKAEQPTTSGNSRTVLAWRAEWRPPSLAY